MKDYTPYIPYINDFASRSFRDIADQDYVLARIAYRRELDQQFRWCSLQAIEKYLKAILLYNHVSSKGISHNLNKALKRVYDIPDLQFSLPSDVEKFIGFISQYGSDRYLSHPTYLEQYALLTLDKTVWYIRRYCFYLRQVIKKEDGDIELFEINKKKATHKNYEPCKHKYKVFNGYLEKVIDKKLPVYDDLVWKNFYYGKRKKNKINFPRRMSFINPTHSNHPEVFDVLEELVDFPGFIKKQYKSK